MKPSTLAPQAPRRRSPRRVFLGGLLAAGALAGLAPARGAEQQPIVRLLVGFPPGGTTDVIARLVASELGTRLNRSVIVENRPGASGSIAASYVAKAPADGNTLLFAPSSHATNVTLYPNQPFDTTKDLSAVGLVAATPYVLVVNPAMPVHSVREFIAYLKANPDKVDYASASPGTGQHLAAEMFKSQAHVNMLHVPYKGSSAALPDLLAGRTPVMFDNIAVMLPYIKSGAVRPLAVTTTKRSQLLPDAPTITESGVPGFEVTGWFGLFTAARTPLPVIASFNAALNAATDSAAFKQRLAELGAETISGTPASADAFVRREITRWEAVIHEAKISLN
ncbi:MAG: tripartite tricarboxylate transporter substrate binding protein [Pseudomonadota bacterium]